MSIIGHGYMITLINICCNNNYIFISLANLSKTQGRFTKQEKKKNQILNTWSITCHTTGHVNFKLQVFEQHADNCLKINHACSFYDLVCIRGTTWNICTFVLL